MNNCPCEFTAEYHRQRILEEVEQIRLERLVGKLHIHRPGLFGRMLCHVGDWMISTGKQLHQQYDVHNETGISSTAHSVSNSETRHDGQIPMQTHRGTERA